MNAELNAMNLNLRFKFRFRKMPEPEVQVRRSEKQVPNLNQTEL
jgi:hypothetical protein